MLISHMKARFLAMILEVKQTKTVGTNEFDVICDGTLTYRGSASWFPMGVDKTNKVFLYDLEGNVVFETKYSLMENLAEALKPFKKYTKKGQKLPQYQILDTTGNDVACFYDMRRLLIDCTIGISYGSRLVLGYTREMGMRDVVSLYENDAQIGLITHSRTVVDNQDQYLVHILPTCNDLMPVIAMYTIFYDFCRYNHSGQYFKGVSYHMSYTYDIHQKKYNKNFIRRNFGEEEHQRVEQFIKGDGKYSNQTKMWLLFFGIWLLVLGIFVLAWLLNRYLPQ